MGFFLGGGGGGGGGDLVAFPRSYVRFWKLDKIVDDIRHICIYIMAFYMCHNLLVLCKGTDEDIIILILIILTHFSYISKEFVYLEILFEIGRLSV